MLHPWVRTDFSTLNGGSQTCDSLDYCAVGAVCHRLMNDVKAGHHLLATPLAQSCCLYPSTFPCMPGCHQDVFALQLLPQFYQCFSSTPL